MFPIRFNYLPINKDLRLIGMQIFYVNVTDKDRQCLRQTKEVFLNRICKDCHDNE